jgi:hypothetical protein
LAEFSDKIKKIYKKNTVESQDPSLKDLVKWVRSMALKDKENETKMGKKTDDTGSTWKLSKVK